MPDLGLKVCNMGHTEICLSFLRRQESLYIIKLLFGNLVNLLKYITMHRDYPEDTRATKLASKLIDRQCRVSLFLKSIDISIRSTRKTIRMSSIKQLVRHAQVEAGFRQN